MPPVLLHYAVRTSLRAALCLICIFDLTLAPAHAQDNLVAYFPLDGDPAPGQFYAPGQAPQTVPGKIDQALLFGDGAVIALPLDLGQYHQLAFTAWVKITDPDRLDGKLVSSGIQPGPEVKMQNGRFALSAGRRTLKPGTPMTVGEWTFVAGVIDVDAGEARVHQGDLVETSSGEIETDLDRLQPKVYDDPNDPQADPQRFVFIGARDFRLDLSPADPADGIAIDDVRIYSAALSTDEVEAMRTNPAPLAVGPYPPRPEEEANEGEMADASDGGNDGGGSGSGDETADAGGDSANDDSNTEGSGLGPDATGWHLWETRKLARLSGSEGEIRRSIDLKTVPLHRIGWEETTDVPCSLVLNKGEDAEESYGYCQPIGAVGPPPNSEQHYVDIGDAAGVTELRVCINRKRNARVKGIRLEGYEVAEDGQIKPGRSTDEEELPNCRDWKRRSTCDDGAVASGVVAHFNQASRDMEQLVGLQLICRDIIRDHED